MDKWLAHFESTATTATQHWLGADPMIVAKGPGTELPHPAGLKQRSPTGT